MPPISRRRDKTLPERLTTLGFTQCHRRKEKRIYLPATEKFPTSPCIREDEVLFDATSMFPNRRPLVSLVGQMRARKSSKPSQHREELLGILDDVTAELLLEQARARLGQKPLPGYTRLTEKYRPFEADLLAPWARGLDVVCESISEATLGSTLRGSYVTLVKWGHEQDITAMAREIIDHLTGVFAAFEVTGSYLDKLQAQHPNYPWAYNNPRASS